MQLGIFPSWQYSADPAVNPKINPNVQYPPGMYQTTVQPVAPYWGGPVNGLGGVAGPQVKLLGMDPLFQMGGHGRTGRLLGFRGLGTIGDTVSSIGTFIILGLAAFGGWNVYKKFTKR